jgi:hypothetical protein
MYSELYNSNHSSGANNSTGTAAAHLPVITKNSNNSLYNNSKHIAADINQYYNPRAAQLANQKQFINHAPQQQQQINQTLQRSQFNPSGEPQYTNANTGNHYNNSENHAKPSAPKDQLMNSLVNITANTFHINASTANQWITSISQSLFHNDANHNNHNNNNNSGSSVIWLQKILLKSHKLTHYALESNSLFFLLDLIKPGFSVHNNPELTALTAQLLTQISLFANKISPNTADATWIWFTSPSSSTSGHNSAEFSAKSSLPCLDLYLQLYSAQQNNNSFTENPVYFNFLNQYVYNHYFELFSLYLSCNSVLNSPLNYLNYILFLLPHYKSNEIAWHNALADGLLELLLDYAIVHAKSNINSLIVRTKSLELLTKLWLFFHNNHNSKLGKFQATVIELLRKTAQESKREKQRKNYNSAQFHTKLHYKELYLLISMAFSCLFQLLDLFIATKHSLAPIVYKTVICNLLELIAAGDNGGGSDSAAHSQPNSTSIGPLESKLNLQMLEFVLQEFCTLLDSHSELPVAVLIEPIVTQYSLHGFRSGLLDYNFLAILALHPRLSWEKAILLLHLLGKAVLADKPHSKNANKPFLALIDRFSSEPDILLYIEKYIKVVLSLFMKATQQIHENCSQESAKLALLGEEKQLNHVDPGVNLARSAAVKHQLTIDIVSQIYYLNHKAIGDIITPLLAFIYEDCMKLYGNVHSRLKLLLPTVNQHNYREIAMFYARQQEAILAEQQQQQQQQQHSGKAQQLVKQPQNGTESVSKTKPKSAQTAHPTAPVASIPSSQASTKPAASKIIENNAAPTTNNVVSRIPVFQGGSKSTVDQFSAQNNSGELDSADPRMSVEDFVGAIKAAKANKAPKQRDSAEIPSKSVSTVTVARVQEPAPASPPHSARSHYTTLTQFTTLSAATSLNTVTTAAPPSIGANFPVERAAPLPNSAGQAVKRRAAEELDQLKRRRESKLAQKASAEAAERERTDRINEQAKRAAKLRRDRVLQQGKPQESEEINEISGNSAITVASVPQIIMVPARHARMEREEPNLDYSYYPVHIKSIIHSVYSEILAKFFKFYYGKTPNTAKSSSFAAINAQSKAISLPDYMKFAQDLCLVPGLAAKLHVQTMFNQVCKEESEKTGQNSESKASSSVLGLNLALFFKSMWCFARLADLTNAPTGPRPKKQREEEEIKSLWAFIQYLHNASLQPGLFPPQIKLNWPNFSVLDLIELPERLKSQKIRKMCVGIVHQILAKAINAPSAAQLPQKPRNNIAPAAAAFAIEPAEANSALLPPNNSNNLARENEILGDIAKAERAERARAAKLRAAVEQYRKQQQHNDLQQQLLRDEAKLRAELEEKSAAQREKQRRAAEKARLERYKREKSARIEQGMRAEVERERAGREERKKTVEMYKILKEEKKKIQAEEEQRRLEQIQAQLQAIQAKAGTSAATYASVPANDNNNTDNLAPPERKSKKGRRKWNIGEDNSSSSTPTNAALTATVAAAINAVRAVQQPQPVLATSSSTAILSNVEQAIASARELRKSVERQKSPINQLDEEERTQRQLTAAEAAMEAARKVIRAENDEEEEEREEETLGQNDVDDAEEDEEEVDPATEPELEGEEEMSAEIIDPSAIHSAPA